MKKYSFLLVALALPALFINFASADPGFIQHRPISSGGTVTAGGLCLEDDVELQLGTACGDSALYYDGTDTYWLLQDASATGGLMLALEDSPPAPDTESVYIWKGASGGVTTCPPTAGHIGPC